jgi:hypothetical protein
MTKNDPHAGSMTTTRPFTDGGCSGSFVLDHLLAKYAGER